MRVSNGARGCSCLETLAHHTLNAYLQQLTCCGDEEVESSSLDYTLEPRDLIAFVPMNCAALYCVALALLAKRSLLDSANKRTLVAKFTLGKSSCFRPPSLSMPAAMVSGYFSAINCIP